MEKQKKSKVILTCNVTKNCWKRTTRKLIDRFHPSARNVGTWAEFIIFLDWENELIADVLYWLVRAKRRQVWSKCDFFVDVWVRKECRLSFLLQLRNGEAINLQSGVAWGGKFAFRYTYYARKGGKCVECRSLTQSRNLPDLHWNDSSISHSRLHSKWKVIAAKLELGESLISFS